MRRAAARLPRAERGLLPGLVVGDTSAMPAAETADFQRSGLTHLTAVSGANLAVVVAAVFWLLRWTALSIRGRAFVTAAALVGFVVLARPTPSVLRAAGMGLLALAAIALGRPRALLPALLATSTALVLFAPTLATSAGFALSVLATLALLVLAPGWTAALRRAAASRARAAGSGVDDAARRAAGLHARHRGDQRHGEPRGGAGEPAGASRRAAHHGPRPAGRHGRRWCRRAWPACSAPRRASAVTGSSSSPTPPRICRWPPSRRRPGRLGTGGRDRW